MLTNKKLLVVVDYQVDFVNGSLGFERAAAIEEGICKKILEYRGRGDDVIFTLDTHEQKYLMTVEGRHLPVKHCIKGTPGWQLYGRVAQLARGSMTIEKDTFPAIKLANHLKEHKYGSIELVGLVSNICVLSNAVIAKAASPDSEISVDARCTAGADPDLHEKALDVMQGLHITVTGRE